MSTLPTRDEILNDIKLEISSLEGVIDNIRKERIDSDDRLYEAFRAGYESGYDDIKEGWKNYQKEIAKNKQP